ncbi:MAG: RNA-directed DNA polymerase [Candidatus Brocadiia bacterium]
MKSILELTDIEARKFLLKQESYCSIDLPVYYSFQPLLDAVSTAIDNKSLSDFYGTYSEQENKKDKPTRPCDYENLNYMLLDNKDGKYAWRPLQLIHPAIYIDLVNRMTSTGNWAFITKRFEQFRQNKQLLCISLPVESESEKSDKASSVEQWWLEIEQQSIELGLDYEFILHTDISNCYGSLYTHSIAWALHGKDEAKKYRKDKTFIGNVIDECIRNMAYGQTNGIPQGSVLMNFIAEIILGFADLQLVEKIKNQNINDYKILRYRDDYRIFTNNPQDTDFIVKYLTEVLIDLGMKLNSSKTIASSNVVRDSLKPDKLYWMNQKQLSSNLQEELFIIHSLSEKYPNSGVLVKLLLKFFYRIENIKETREHLSVLISIIVDIMLKNPRTYPTATAILSKLISLQENNDVRLKMIKKVKARFDKIPNTGYLEVWLQRLILKLDMDIIFKEKLCEKVNNNQAVIWNSEWLNTKLKNLIDSHSIIDSDKIDKMDKIIDRTEVELFQSIYWES